MTVLAALALLAAAPAGVMHQASGSFDVTVTPEAQVPAPGASGLPTSRMAIAKTFTGAVVGRAVGTMLAAGTPGAGKAAAYVAIDQFSGSVDGRTGGFLLLHRGTADGAGTSTLDVSIAPGSGSGDLTGIEGTLSIDTRGGGHRYTLSYTLPVD